MKKITLLLLCLMVTSYGFSQVSAEKLTPLKDLNSLGFNANNSARLAPCSNDRSWDGTASIGSSARVNAADFLVPAVTDYTAETLTHTFTASIGATIDATEIIIYDNLAGNPNNELARISGAIPTSQSTTSGVFTGLDIIEATYDLTTLGIVLSGGLTDTTYWIGLSAVSTANDANTSSLLNTGGFNGTNGKTSFDGGVTFLTYTNRDVNYSLTGDCVLQIQADGEVCEGNGPTTLDGAPGTVNSLTINIPRAGTIGADQTDMFTLNAASLDGLLYNQVQELTATLTSPAGTIITLFANDGGNSADGTPRDLVFTDASANDVNDWDDAGTFMADFMAEGGSLNDAFDGESITGDWVLTISNGGANGGGTLDDFCLDFSNNGTVGNEPTIECPMDIVADNDEDACGAVVNFANAIALDAEDGPIATTQVADGAPVSGEEFPVGVTTVTFEATDSNGNTVMCSFDVTVNDVTEPTIECPAAILMANDAGVCGADVTVPNPTVTDNCEDEQPGTFVNDFNGTDDASDFYPVGTTTVEFTYTDAGGNTTTCTVDVTVEDTEAPVIACEGAIDDTVSETATPGTSIDTDATDVITTSVISVTDDQIITDANVNLDLTHTFIGDIQATLTSPAGTSVLIYDGPANSGGAFGCGGEDLLVTFDDEGTASVDDTCNAGSIPAISGTLIPSNPLSAFDGESTLGDWTLTIEDTFPGLDSGTFNAWGLELMYEATPLPPLVVELDVDGLGSIAPEDLVISATDNCGAVTVSAGGVSSEAGCDLMGDLEDDATSANTWDRPFAAGTCCSGLGPVSFSVYGPFTVDTDGDYTFNSVQAFDGYVFLYETSFDPLDPLVGFITGDDDGAGGIGTSDLDDVALVTGTEYFFITTAFSAGDFGAYTTTITGPGAVSCGSGAPATVDFTCEDVGLNEVEVVVTDTAGNEAMCTAIVDVQDNTDPVIVCQDFTLELEDDGTAVLDPLSLLDATMTVEACGFDVVTADVTNFDCSNIGTPTLVTIFVQDPSGNIASCSAMVTVVDVNGPVLTCPDDQVRETEEGTGTYTMEDFTGLATATDGCSATSTIAQDPAVGTALGVGSYTVTLTATDDLGNMSTCTFTLDVDFLGVDENELSNAIAMYPNPATAIVNLSNTSNIALDRAAIYDVNGKMVSDVNLEGLIGERAIDVSALASGVYIVQISGEGTTIAKRLIIE